MSFDVIKNKLVSRLGALGYSESKQSWDFENASVHEYDNSFILRCREGENIETLVGQFDDEQTWEIDIAFTKSSKNDVINRDIITRRLQEIIKDLDNPTNWQGITNGSKMQRYESWELTDVENYFLLTITLKIVDQLTF